MKALLFSFSVAVSMFFAVSQAESPNGFYVWSDYLGELKIQKLEAGKGPVGEAKTLVWRGSYSDIQAAISFDGKYVAFARQLKQKIMWEWNELSGYEIPGNFDIYIARIDGELPADAKKVGHGYCPSWGDDSDQPVKTLYYSWVSGDGVQNDEELKIMKATIGPDGAVSTPREHIKLPSSSANPQMQCSPDGRYVAGQINDGAIHVYDSQTKELSSIIQERGLPSWGSDSHWLFWGSAYAVAEGRLVGEKVPLPFASSCGWSQDMKWVIGRIGNYANDQNTPHELQIHSVVLSKKGEEESCSNELELELPPGTWCDLHVEPSVDVFNKLTPQFNIWQVKAASGNLMISVDFQGKYFLSLYDMKGIFKTRLFNQGPSLSTMPVQGISARSYIMYLDTDEYTGSKKIIISK